MILVDTSVWVDHLRSPDAELTDLLTTGDLMIHPLVIEELACGNFPNRAETLESLGELPSAKSPDHQELLDLIEREKFAGSGLSAIDVHLIAAALLSRAQIWSRDQGLMRSARRLGIALPRPN